MTSGNWEIKECLLEEVCEIMSSMAFTRNNFCVSGIPLVRIQNIHEGKIQMKESKTEYICSNASNMVLINYGDLIIAASGNTTGKIARSNYFYPLALNQRIYKISPKCSWKIDKNYLYYFFENSYIEIQNLVTRGGRNQI